MRPFKIETLRFLYAIILHLLGLHDSFKLLKRQVTETDKLTVMCILYNIYPSPSRSPLCSISLTCSSLIFPVLFITSRNSDMETFPSPFLSKPSRKVCEWMNTLKLLIITFECHQKKLLIMREVFLLFRHTYFLRLQCLRSNVKVY